MEVKTLQSRCRVGVARGDITPEVGTYHRMWGAASHDCSEGVHRPLTATALAFGSLDGNDDERQVVLAVDHCLLGFDEVENILNLVHEQSGVDRTRIVTTFSHTHAAGMLLERCCKHPDVSQILSFCLPLSPSRIHGFALTNAFGFVALSGSGGQPFPESETRGFPLSFPQNK